MNQKLHIPNIRIENFRGLREICLDNLTNLNILVGDNNCGKTSVLEAILLNIGVNNPNLAIIIDNLRGFVHLNGDDIKYLFYQQKYDNTPRIKCGDNVLEIEASYKKIDFNKEKNNNSIEMLSLEEEDKFNSIDLKFTQGKSKPFVNSTTFIDPGNRETKINKNYIPVRGGLIHSNYFDRPNIQTLNSIRVTKSENKITEELRKIDFSIEDWEIGGNNRIYLSIKGESERRLLNFMGGGVVKMFCILTELYSYENGIILIDEIENGLYYKTTEDLIKYLFSFIKENPKTQFFITTHSFDFLNSLQKVANDKKYEKYKNFVNVISIVKDDRKKDKGNEFYTYYSNIDDLRNNINLNNEVR